MARRYVDTGYNATRIRLRAVHDDAAPILCLRENHLLAAQLFLPAATLLSSAAAMRYVAPAHVICFLRMFIHPRPLPPFDYFRAVFSVCRTML